MKFSICIPTLNEEKYIGGILGCLTKQTHKDFEVIVADGKSEDKTKEAVLKFANKLDVRFVKAPKRGTSFQRNYAAKYAGCDYIIFFDADVMIDHDFLEKIGAYLEKHTVDILTCWNEPLSNRLDDELIYLFINIFELELIKKINPGAVGVFICVKKKAFEKIGGFREQLHFAEDYDLAKRFFKSGFKYALLKKPKVKVSVRRFDKDGRFQRVMKEFKAITNYLVNGGDYEKLQKKIKYKFGKF
jgi:glycosyltransferase involved in cell wall biosynthesis